MQATQVCLVEDRSGRCELNKLKVNKTPIKGKRNVCQKLEDAKLMFSCY